jgi:hypothetical protein
LQGRKLFLNFFLGILTKFLRQNRQSSGTIKCTFFALTGGLMENTDLEWDGMASQSPRTTGVPDNDDSISTSSESSESISERRSLLGEGSKQVENYGGTEIPGEQQDAVAENDETTEVQHTPGAIAAVISVLLVGGDPLSIAR